MINLPPILGTCWHRFHTFFPEREQVLAYWERLTTSPLEVLKQPLTFLLWVSAEMSGDHCGVTDLPLWPETLLLDLTTVRFNKGSQKVYRDRKMDSDPENFFITELADTSLGGETDSDSF